MAVSGTGRGGAGATGVQITEVTAKPQQGPLWWEVKLSQALLLTRKDGRGYKGVMLGGNEDNNKWYLLNTYYVLGTVLGLHMLCFTEPREGAYSYCSHFMGREAASGR